MERWKAILDIEETAHGLMRRQQLQNQRTQKFYSSRLFIASFKSGCGREMLSTAILCFHTHSKTGLEIDQLKFNWLPNDPSLER
jgi:hypothetical protein